MFSLLKKRKDRANLEKYVNQVADITNPLQPPLQGESRNERRYARNFPVLVAPLQEDESFRLDECEVGLCKDLSARGMAVVFRGPFVADAVVAGIWPINDAMSPSSSQPGFLLGVVRQTTPIGGGFHQVGIEFQQVLGQEWDSLLEPLRPLMREMLFAKKTC